MIIGQKAQGYMQRPSGVYAPNWVSNGTTPGSFWTTDRIRHDTRKFLLSCWLQISSWPVTNYGYMIFQQRAGANLRAVSTANNGSLGIYQGNAGNSNNFAFTAAGSLPSGVLNHVLVSYDTDRTPVCQVYINDVGNQLSSWGGGNPSQSFNREVFFFRDINSFVDEYTVPFTTDIFLMYADTLDIDVEANRRLFYSAAGTPVDLGESGEIPFGYSPDYYFGRYQTATEWNSSVSATKNLGTQNASTWSFRDGPFTDAASPL